MSNPQGKKRPTFGRGVQRLRNEIMYEQVVLMQSQRNLQSLITKVNEQLNVLKVEELQLRSNAVHSSTQQQIQVKTEPIASVSKTYDFDKSNEAINKQNLNLDVFVANIFNKLEEEEEDD